MDLYTTTRKAITSKSGRISRGLRRPKYTIYGPNVLDTLAPSVSCSLLFPPPSLYGGKKTKKKTNQKEKKEEEKSNI